MIDCQEVWNLANSPLMGNSMREAIIMPRKPESTVSRFRVPVALPFPAIFSALDQGHEPK